MKIFEKLTVVLTFLATIPNMASVSIANIFGKNKTVISATLYAAVWLDTLQNGNFLNANTKVLPGISSFDGQQIPKGVDFVVTGIRMLTHSSGTNEATAGQPGLLLNTWADTPLPLVKNAELTITQGALLFTAPGTDVSNFRASTGNDDDFRTIDAPFRIRGGVDFQINIALAGAAVAERGVKIEMRGYYLADTDVASGRS